MKNKLPDKESKLIEEHRELVISEVIETLNSKSDLEDYIQVGFIGLIKAHRKFDPEKGCFENYAKTCVKNEVMASLKKKVKKTVYHKKSDKPDVAVWEVVPDSLSDTEKAVLKMKCQNYTNKEIADMLYLTKPYVKEVYRNCIKKLRIANE
jgi:DNA-directed RNA polymerase specialized sigma subunit